jgi:uncharacterized membrane protein YGL010W
MKSLHQWMEEYAVSHQNPTNIKIHTYAVPLIFIVTLGILWQVPNPGFMGGQTVRLVHVVMCLALYFYYRLGRNVFRTMTIFMAGSLLFNQIGLFLMGEGYLFLLLVTFLFAWLAQFYGHKVEGKKPSFINDLQFLLVGPVWVFKKLNLL